MKIYTQREALKIFNNYISKGGIAQHLDDGVLGIGDWVCYGEGLKTCVIKEVCLNEWSSGQTIRLYNKMPKKYRKILETI